MKITKGVVKTIVVVMKITRSVVKTTVVMKITRVGPSTECEVTSYKVISLIKKIVNMNVV